MPRLGSRVRIPSSAPSKRAGQAAFLRGWTRPSISAPERSHRPSNQPEVSMTRQAACPRSRAAVSSQVIDTPQLGGVLGWAACLCDTMAFRVDRAQEGLLPPTGLPVGTVTFVLGDVAGSTRLWEERAANMPAALTQLDEMVGTLVAASGGTR